MDFPSLCSTSDTLRKQLKSLVTCDTLEPAFESSFGTAFRISDREGLIACELTRKLNHMWTNDCLWLQEASANALVCDMTFHYNNSNQMPTTRPPVNRKTWLLRSQSGFNLWTHHTWVWQTFRSTSMSSHVCRLSRCCRVILIIWWTFHFLIAKSKNYFDWWKCKKEIAEECFIFVLGFEPNFVYFWHSICLKISLWCQKAIETFAKLIFTELWKWKSKQSSQI